MNDIGEQSFEFEECDALHWCIAAIQEADTQFGPITTSEDQHYYFSAEVKLLRAKCLLADVWNTLHSNWAREEELCSSSQSTTNSNDNENTGIISTSSIASKPAAHIHPTCSSQELHRQVLVDVRRATSSYDCHLNISDVERKDIQHKLSRLVEDVFSACSDEKHDLTKSSVVDGWTLNTNHVELQYLQGAHEICLIILELERHGAMIQKGKKNGMENLCRNIISQRLFSLHSNISLAISVYQLLAHVSTLLRHFSPRLRRANDARDGIFGNHGDSIFTTYEDDSDGSNLHYALPWLITLFAHNITILSTVIRVWNVLFAFPPPFLIYFVSAVASVKGGFLALSSSMTRDVIEADEIFFFLEKALEWLKRYPYANLVRDVATTASNWREMNSKWYETNESFVFKLDTKSVLPPLWAPILGKQSLAVSVASSSCGDTCAIPDDYQAANSRRDVNLFALHFWASAMSAIDASRRQALKQKASPHSIHKNQHDDPAASGLLSRLILPFRRNHNASQIVSQYSGILASIPINLPPSLRQRRRVK